MMQYLTLGFSSCPNDTYIFDGLVHQKIACPYQFQTEIHDVEQLNQMAKLGQLDITKASIHALFHLSDQYQLLDSGAALGRGCGPLWVGRGAEVPTGGRVAIPGEWTTANLLFQLAVEGNFEPCFMGFDQVMDAVNSGEVDSGVIIHESRFTYQEKGLKSYMDLGDWWESESGQPIPLGGILVRRDLDPELKITISRLIRESIEFADEHPGSSKDYIKALAQEIEGTVIQKHIDLYVNPFSKTLGDSGREAILQLYQVAQNKGLVHPGDGNTLFV